MKGLKTGGRAKGVPNKATAEVRAVAQQYTEEAIEALVRVLRAKKSPPQAVVAAARELLDRGHGRAVQSVAGDPERPLETVTRVLFGGRYRPVDPEPDGE